MPIRGILIRFQSSNFSDSRIDERRCGMPLLVQGCMVVVTIGLLALAFLTARAVTRFFNRAEADFSQLTFAVRESAMQIDLAGRETRALVASLRDCVPPVQRVMDRFEEVGQRTADLSSVILEEFGGPVFTAAAAAHGVRSGTDHFLKRLMHRFDHHHSQFPGGNNHE
jgi:hypothetical protein